MIRNVLCAIRGVDVYPVLALVLFALVFAGAIVAALAMRPADAAARSRMPLDDASPGAGGGCA